MTTPPIGFPKYTCELCWPSPEWWDFLHKQLEALGQHGPAHLIRLEPTMTYYASEERRYVGQMQARYYKATRAFDGSWAFLALEEPYERTVHGCECSIETFVRLWCAHAGCRASLPMSRMVRQDTPDGRTMDLFAEEIRAKGWEYDDIYGQGTCPLHTNSQEKVA